MVPEKDENAAWATADNWKSAAIALAIITPVVAAFTLPWILSATSDGAILRRVQIVGAGVAVGLALVTFCTVVWRGMIATMQAELQRAQLDKLSEQIAANDRQNLAALFHKGAEMIAEDNAPNVAAGISTLQIVATGPDEDFAIQAMNIIADHIEEKGPTYLTEQRGHHAVDTLNRVARVTSRRGQRRLNFEFPGAEPTLIDSTRLPIGAGRVKVSNARFESDGFTIIEQTETYAVQKLTADGCIFDTCEIDLRKFRAIKSIFEDCSIIYWRPSSGNVFRNCDFSGCEIKGKLPDLRSSGCYFDVENPPRGNTIEFWSRRLEAHRVPEFVDDDETPDADNA